MPRLIAITVLAVCVAVPVAAQFAERIDVIAVEVPISVRDRDGKVPTDLTKDDFEVFEDGVRQEVIGLTYPVALVSAGEAPAVQRQKWQIVLFLQESTSTTPGLRSAFKGLLEEVDRITALGDVEIVSDFPSPHVVLPPTGDASVLRDKLRELQQRTAIGRDEVNRIRRQFRMETRRAALPREALLRVVMLSAQAEAALVRRRQDALLSWMSRYGESRADTRRLLVFVSDGYPLDPVRFYIDGDPAAGDLADLLSLSSAPRQDELARTVAAFGWTVFSIAPRALFNASGTSMVEMSSAEIIGRKANVGDALDAMFIFNDATGGKLTTDVRRIRGVLETFTQRLTLTYQARRRRDGALRSLEIRTRRRGLTIESQRAVMSATAESVAAARATSLALESGERGELPVTCRIRDETLVATVDLTRLADARAAMTAATLRVAIGVTPDRKPPFHDVQRFDEVDLSAIEKWEVSIPIRNRGRAPIAIVIEEIATGAWGGSRCE